MNWYCDAGNENLQIHHDELVKMIKGRQIPINTLVWKMGMNEWVPLSECAELNKHIPDAQDMSPYQKRAYEKEYQLALKDNRKTYSVLSYLSLWWVGMLGNGKDYDISRFHMAQGVAFTIFKAVVLFAAAILSEAARYAFSVEIAFGHTAVPAWVAYMAIGIWASAGILIAVLMICGIRNASNLLKKPLPVIGRFVGR